MPAAPWETFGDTQPHTRACTCDRCARRWPRRPHGPTNPDAAGPCRYCGGTVEPRAVDPTGAVIVTCRTCGSSRYQSPSNAGAA